MWFQDIALLVLPQHIFAGVSTAHGDQGQLVWSVTGKWRLHAQRAAITVCRATPQGVTAKTIPLRLM